jgi:two-component system chemotaxis sensor kinase CheA
MDNISTQQEVTELAGRGVGLAAVLNETKNMGGDVVVKTVSGQGTQFIFTLPLPKEILNEES